MTTSNNSPGNSPGKQTERPNSSPTKYPSAKQVDEFHRNADTDKRPESLHHTLGNSRYKASPGDHTHDGGSSALLFNGVTITGSRVSGAALSSLLTALAAIGIIDGTSP